MRILLVNDDGIDSVGINTLAESLCVKHEVYVVAPKLKKSCASQSISLGEISFERMEPGALALKIAVNGTPSDCVKLAVLYFMKDALPDLVVSGINDASNLGAETMYSGTVGAALESSYLGIPAIALSCVNRDFTEGFALAAEFLTSNLERLRIETIPKKTILNINYPSVRAKGVKICRTFIHYYTDHYVDRGPGVVKLEGDPIVEGIDEESDVYLCHKGFITIVPMDLDRNDGVFAFKYGKIIGDIVD